MGAEIEVEPTASGAASRSATLRVARRASCARPRSAAPRCRWRSTSCRWSRSPPASPRATTTIRDAAELRRKESDRIATVSAALTALGGEVEATAGRHGRSTGSGGLRGGTIDSHGDHRIAMLGAVAGLASREGVEVEGMDAAAVSYPGFEADLAALLGASA